MVRLGSLLHGDGRIREARCPMRAALELARDRSDGRLECDAIKGLGKFEGVRGSHGQALACYEHALILARGFCGRDMQGMLLGNLSQRA
jgi:hypothetical protein